MPSPLTSPTSTPFGAVFLDSTNAVRKPVLAVESELSSTTRVSTPPPSPPATTIGPRPAGALRPGREMPTMPLSIPAPTLITSLPAPPSTRTGTVAAELATVMLSLPALPLTSSCSTVPSATGASYLTCWVGAEQSGAHTWSFVTRMVSADELPSTTSRLPEYHGLPVSLTSALMYAPLPKFLKL